MFLLLELWGVPVEVTLVPHKVNHHVSLRPLFAGLTGTHERRMTVQPIIVKGADINQLPISGSSGDGISTVIIFILTIVLITLGTVGLWFLYRCVKESDD